ncbi:MAG: hypothetical protein EOO38_06985 [Cytophagaceae bacterium]|nr:MAG: hypothetical protein EOO38_06985 [Cytophagaceae bacterium]
MNTNISVIEKPALHRSSGSDSERSVASTASKDEVRGRREPPLNTQTSWGYVYGAATFAKSPEHMSGVERRFAKEVASRLGTPSPLRPQEWNDAPPTRVQTVRAQIEQWRAEDEAREAIRLLALGASTR